MKVIVVTVTFLLTFGVTDGSQDNKASFIRDLQSYIFEFVFELPQNSWCGTAIKYQEYPLTRSLINDVIPMEQVYLHFNSTIRRKKLQSFHKHIYNEIDCTIIFIDLYKFL